MPMTLSGRAVAAAISSTSSVEVFVASKASGLADRVELGEQLLLDRHLLEHRLDDEVRIGDGAEVGRRRECRPMRCSTSSRRQAPFGGGRLVVLANHREAAIERILLTSTTVTGMPALAKFIAMPPPIVPAPTIAALRISPAGVSAGTSGIFAASRSAKKKYRCAFDSGELKHVEEKLALALDAASNGRFDGRFDASMQRRERASRASAALRDFRKLAKTSGLPRAAASFSSRSRTC